MSIQDVLQGLVGKTVANDISSNNIKRPWNDGYERLPAPVSMLGSVIKHAEIRKEYVGPGQERIQLALYFEEDGWIHKALLGLNEEIELMP